MINRRPPKIKIERILRDLTQAELGRKIGISQPFLSLVESGQRTPSRKTAESLAAALGIKVEEVFDERAK